MSDELQVWQPSPFEGEDLLPVQSVQHAVGPADIEVIQEEDLEAEDIRLPKLEVLQGTSEVVQSGNVDGAQPGKLYFSGNGTVIKPPARFIVIHRFRGNAMFARTEDPAFEGLETCISRDGKTGTKYGPCELCKKCTEWRGDEPPLGSKTQQFVVWMDSGIGILRVALSNKHATKAMRDVMTRKTTTQRNWFAHPMVATVEKHTNKDDKPFQVIGLKWDESQVVPDDIQRACFEWYGRIVEALKAGTLTDDEEDTGTPKPPTQDAGASTAAPGGDDIPF